MRQGRLGLLERQILRAILGAFGNMQTQQDDNSVRFGNFIKIRFSLDRSISGANIDQYLPEMTRVGVPSAAERNFYVFYRLLSSKESSNGKSLKYLLSAYF
jgi:myosin heavy subunit